MKKKSVKNALEALEDYFEIQPVDIAKFLGVDPGRITECKKKPNIDNLGRYFSVYKDTEANFAMSKRVSLMECVYYEMFRLGNLIDKLVQEQSDTFEKNNMLAKRERFELVKEYFFPIYLGREFFCLEDEACYRILDVKKTLLLIQKKIEYKELESLISEAISKLNDFEKNIIEKRAEDDNLSEFDVVDKCKKMKRIFSLLGINELKEIDNIINKMYAGGPFYSKRAHSNEENGSNTNFNLVLDEFFDVEEYDDCFFDEFRPKVEPAYRPYISPDDQEEMNKGNLPIFFVFKNTRYYAKAYIKKDIRKSKISQGFKDAVYEQYLKIKDKTSEYHSMFSDSDRNFCKNEIEEKIKWENVHAELETWKDDDGLYFEKENVARRVRKTLNEDMKKNYKLLCVIRS